MEPKQQKFTINVMLGKLFLAKRLIQAAGVA